MLTSKPCKIALILGISGQDGSLLAKYLLSKGYIVHGTSRDAKSNSFYRLKVLGIFNNVILHSVLSNDLASVLSLLNLVRPLEIYNLAGQSSVGLSYVKPVETLDSIATAGFILLDAVRLLGYTCKVYNACSSECFGDTGTKPADELTPFKPLSPYAIAKAATFYQSVNYRTCYNLFVCSGILFNHESCFRTPSFVTRKISLTAARIAHGSNEKLLLGDLTIQRDWGWAPEYVEAMWRMLQQDIPTDFVISTGRAYSLIEFADAVFSYHQINLSDYLVQDQAFFRPQDISFSCGNPSKASSILSWESIFSLPEIAARMAYHDYELLKHTS